MIFRIEVRIYTYIKYIHMEKRMSKFRTRESNIPVDKR